MQIQISIVDIYLAILTRLGLCVFKDKKGVFSLRQRKMSPADASSVHGEWISIIAPLQQIDVFEGQGRVLSH